MWQLYQLCALLTSATQDVVDKFALTRSPSIDSIVATLLRTACFWLAIIVIGLTGILGPLGFVFSWEILLFVPMCAGVSVVWTYLLRKVEVMTIGAMSYFAPLVYLFIDSHLLQINFSLGEILGVLLLVIGGFGFSVDAKTLRMKSELGFGVWAALIFTLLYNGCEAYLFKHLHSVYGLNGVSFFASLWLLSGLILLLIVLFRGKGKQLVDRTSRVYIPRVAFSKACDAGSSVLTAQALSIAAVSQVGAFDALLPLISFGLVMITQKILGLNLDEKLSRGHAIWKACLVGLLVAGGFLVQ